MTGLNTRRWARVAGFLLPLLLLLLSTSIAAASDAAVFSGSVTDAVGNIIEDVEVLAVTLTTGSAPTAAVRSDRRGRFRFDALSPGIYKIVALKRGYLTFVGSVNTSAQSWVDVILHPAPSPGSASDSAIPSNPSWVLRLPRRSILRDVDDRLPGEAADSSAAQPVERSTLEDRLHMRIDQIFSAGANLWSDDDAAPWMQGIETRLHLASAVGERGRFQFTGSRASYDSAPAAGDAATFAGSAATSLLMDFAYDAGSESRLAVKAFLNEQDVRFQEDIVEVLQQPMRRQLRTWGYDAGWSKQLDALSSLELQIDYQDRSLQMPDSPHAVSDRSIGAAGSYVALPVVDHQLEIGFRAQLMDSPTPALLINGGELNQRRYGISGLSIGLDAQDTWFISGPFALLYGVGYRHALTSRDTSMIAPRVGGTWSIDSLVLRFLLSYHRVEVAPGDRLATPERPLQPDRTIGYEAEIELPLAAGLHLTAASSYSPVDMTLPSHPMDGVEPSLRPIYFTDGNAAVDQRRLALVRERAGSRIQLQLGAGSVEGALAPALPYELPIFLLADRHLRFRTGRLGIQIPSSGTELLFDWRKVIATAAESGEPDGESAERSLELQVAQDLMRLRTLGSWRLLMALRKATLETGEDDDLLLAGNPSRQGLTSHSVSAGLSVLF